MTQASSSEKDINEAKFSDFNEEKFRLLAEHVPGAIYLCRNDDHYSTLYVNAHIATITGYSRDDFLQNRKLIGDLIHADDRDAIRETINRQIAERKPFDVVYRLQNKSGMWHWVRDTGVGVY